MLYLLAILAFRQFHSLADRSDFIIEAGRQNSRGTPLGVPHEKKSNFVGVLRLQSPPPDDPTKRIRHWPLRP